MSDDCVPPSNGPALEITPDDVARFFDFHQDTRRSLVPDFGVWIVLWVAMTENLL